VTTASIGALEERIGALEERIGTLLGLDAPVLCRSGHEGFLCLLVALEVEPHDEIVLPVSICQTMVNAVLIAGALPVLADCRPDLSLCPTDLERRLTPASRLIVAHHPHGAACRLGEIRALASAAGVLLLEDCAQSAGAFVDGAPVGRLGDVVLHSFAHDKPFGAGVGGLIAARDPALTQRLRAAARVGSPGHPDDRALGLDSMPRATELDHIARALETFPDDVQARVGKAEAMIAGIGPWGRVVGGELAGRDPREHVFHRVVVELDGCRARTDVERVLAEYRQATPESLHAVVQESVPTPPHRTPYLDRRYRQRGRAELCDPAGAGFPGWRAIEGSYLFLRTSARFAQHELVRAVSALAAARARLRAS
jgi:DegT/DnrJ/EryC1/StrS aminotransferase family